MTIMGTTFSEDRFLTPYLHFLISIKGETQIIQLYFIEQQSI